MDYKTSIKKNIMTILIILAVIFVFIFIVHNCWKIHQEDIKTTNGLINVDRINTDDEKNK